MGTKKKNAEQGLQKAIETLLRRRKPSAAQQHERSRRIVPSDPEIHPEDTLKDAEERWDTESPAIPPKPGLSSPEA